MTSDDGGQTLSQLVRNCFVLEDCKCWYMRVCSQGAISLARPLVEEQFEKKRI